MTAEEALKWVEQRFGATAAIASSFGLEDVVLLELASKHAPSVKVFTLDTGRLPAETYELIDRLRERYGVKFETFFPNTHAVEELVTGKGHFSFRQSVELRKECCGIRKVEPLSRALAGRAAWVTGLRREQAATRAAVEVTEQDAAHGGIWKINPLAEWTQRQCWDFVKEHHLPVNALHQQGYPSIGCGPCTRAVKPGEDVRAGRWWWESPDHKECGLHLPAPDGGTK
ncbi:MAG: phosphoadenosine phosphosulfate reductase [Myxococcaceae bacterium]|nr:phosphoadenosine phosphosulfate reductase [Myxococcaceae bacterium]